MSAKPCHGCNGAGWVRVTTRTTTQGVFGGDVREEERAQKCPVCLGIGNLVPPTGGEKQ